MHAADLQIVIAAVQILIIMYIHFHLIEQLQQTTTVLAVP